jgi:uncharacterized protein
LRIKIKEIPEEGLSVDQAVTPELLRDALTGTDADVERTAASIALNLHKVGEDVIASGRLNATLGLSCVACLAPTRLDANVGVRAVFRPDVDPDNEEDLFPHDRKEVDLWPMVREQIILTMPMSIRCKDDCKGLCATCGADRNTVDCGHALPDMTEEAKPKASPFAALKDLKLPS